jgi:hypothetical protein
MTTSGTLIFNVDADEKIDIIDISNNESEEEVLEDEDEEESEDGIYLENKYDFAIVLKHDTGDINFIVPSPDNEDPEFLENTDNFSQNSFLVNFINYALNKSEWLDEYAKNMQLDQDDMLQQFLDFMGAQGLGEEFLEKFKEEMSTIDVTENEKDIDFTSAVAQLNKNKPKIIT